jgi:hypothetical protein
LPVPGRSQPQNVLIWLQAQLPQINAIVDSLPPELPLPCLRFAGERGPLFSAQSKRAHRRAFALALVPRAGGCEPEGKITRHSLSAHWRQSKRPCPMLRPPLQRLSRGVEIDLTREVGKNRRPPVPAVTPRRVRGSGSGPSVTGNGAMCLCHNDIAPTCRLTHNVLSALCPRPWVAANSVTVAHPNWLYPPRPEALPDRGARTLCKSQFWTMQRNAIYCEGLALGTSPPTNATA